MGDPFVYWLLRLVLLSCLFYSGWKISASEKDDRDDSDELKDSIFWKNALIGIIAFALIEGLRWNRGADYPHYYQDLTGDLYTDYKEPLYLLWVYLFKLTGLPGCVGFVFYSGFFIYSYYCLVKQFPKTAVWALPLVPLILSSSENLIRQYFALSFFLLAISEYYKSGADGISDLIHNKKVLFYLCCVPCVHLSGLFVIFVFLGCCLTRENGLVRVFQPYLPFLLSAIYVWTYFFWDVKNFEYFSELLKSVSLGDDTFGAGYVENADRWFTEEGGISQVLYGKENEVAGLVVRVPDFLCKLFLIYFGCLAAFENNRYKLLFLFSFFAIIIKTASGDIELYGRFYQWLVFALPLMIGFILSEYEFKKVALKNIVLICFVFHYFLWGVLRNIGFVGYAGCAFIWDK